MLRLITGIYKFHFPKWKECTYNSFYPPIKKISSKIFEKLVAL